MNKKIYLVVLSFILVGSSFFIMNSSFAEEKIDYDNLHVFENDILKGSTIPPSTPYLVNVQLLMPPAQVRLYTDDTDEERNMTTNASEAWVWFNFAPTIFEKAYVTIVENSTNFKVFHDMLSQPGMNDLHFKIGPNMFRENQHYTIYNSTKSTNIGRAFASFYVSSEEQTEIQPPVLDSVKDTDIVVTGSAEPNNTITVYMGDDGPYTANTDVYGKFTVQLPKQYVAGTKIRSFATDSKGNKSEEAISYVEKNSEVLAPPTIDDVYNTDRAVTGTGEPGATLHLFMGGDEYRERIDETGNFRVQLDQTYSAGTKIRAYLVDSNNNQSRETNTEVIQESQGFGVNKILTKDSVVTGRAMPGSKIEVEVNNTKARIFTATTTSNGEFVVDMKGNTYPAGTRVKVTSLMNEEILDSVDVIIYPDSPSIYTVSQGDTSIAGRGEPNAEITILTNNISYTGKADIQGEFKISVPSLTIGQRISVKQTSNGINSETTDLEVKTK